MLIILDLTNSIYHTKWIYNCFKEKVMAQENMGQEFRFINIG